MAKTKTDAKKAAAKLAKDANGEVNLVLLLDESGSMSGKEEAVVSGVNEFVETFKKHKDTTVTLSLFDETAGEERVRVKYAGKPVGKVKALTGKDYNPRGMTPLNDAVIETIKALDGSAGKDGRAFVVILTDGYENASEHSAEDVAKVVKKREKGGWAFLYLGADHDVQKQAAAMGLGKKGQAFMFVSSKRGTRSALTTSSNLAASYAVMDSAGYAAAASNLANSTGGDLGEDEADVDPAN